MPWSFRIDKPRRVVFGTARDVLTDSEWGDALEKIVCDPDFDPSYDNLSDVSKVTDFKVSMRFIRQMASQSIFHETSKQAFVAPQDLAFGSVRAYQGWHYHGENVVNVFRTLDEALRWLGLEDAALAS